MLNHIKSGLEFFNEHIGLFTAVVLVVMLLTIPVGLVMIMLTGANFMSLILMAQALLNGAGIGAMLSGLTSMFFLTLFGLALQGYTSSVGFSAIIYAMHYEGVSIGKALKEGFKKGFKVTIIAFIFSAITLLLTIILSLLPIPPSLILIILFIFNLLMFVFLFFAPYIAVVEEDNILECLMKSIDVAIRNIGSIFLYILTMSLLGVLVMLLLAILQIITKLVGMLGVILGLLSGLVFLLPFIALIIIVPYLIYEESEYYW